ncbi:putrescine ABC transporter permease PotH [Pseudohongiella acticola]|uniref:Putrescine ABC transporter permease PotH n=1 Tax=Pseudohongiella acticola TaxID=1524254 RepID=A0A1E8CNH4_9GAMM|nr:ABC transporter permease subunit [Pseudohongiella acticola]OFE13963.1 putrescine ABC transporter permease PotH [Pseudohongiella acticola]
MRARLRQVNIARGLVTGIPWLWLVVFFCLPFLFIVKISLSEPALAQPPYLGWIRETADGLVNIVVNFGNYGLLWDDSLYTSALLGSLKVASISTALCLLIGYPMAYAIARAPTHLRMPLLMLVILPFWTSFLIRVYAWMGILNTNGILNNLLLWLGVIEQPLAIMHTPLAVYIGVTYAYLPFMVLPLYATLSRLDPVLLEAAADLGARPVRQFFSITWPQSVPGVIAGAMLVFIPVMGEFVIPDLLGGPDSLMLGKLMWTEFFNNRDWPVASSLAAVLLVVLILPFLLLRRYEMRAQLEEAT